MSTSFILLLVVVYGMGFISGWSLGYGSGLQRAFDKKRDSGV